MTREEENVMDERDKEKNLRYIRAKLPTATARQLGIIAAFVRGLGIIGWSDAEFNRDT